MKPENFSSRDQKILFCLSCIPKKMLHIHGVANATEFVLHELCGECCFNFPKAAFFVDNPDFDCCKGVAGWSCDECYKNDESAWHAPQPFSDHMQNAAFNKQVRQMHMASIVHGVDDTVHQLAQQLSMQNPQYCLCDLKHDNRGLLIFEGESKNYDEVKHHLPQGLALLGFCPIF